MVKQGGGQIAIVASIAGLLAMPGAVSYSSPKHFARAYAEELRGRLAPEGIRVSAVCPGFVVSRMTARNKFPMPFLMDTKKAPRTRSDGLAKREDETRGGTECAGTCSARCSPVHQRKKKIK